VQRDAAKTSDAARSGTRLALTKWYFDCVAPDGRVVIGYWAALSWRQLEWNWQNVVLHEPGRAPVRRSSLVRAPPPAVAGESITWSAPALRCRIEVASRQRPIEQRLLEDETGVVEWRVEAPAARVSVDLGGSAPVQGPGYVERIQLTVPPWRLPIRELRWGRWIDAAAGRSVVWIDWRGETPRTWVFVDGVLAPAATVADERVRAGAVDLVLGDSRTLEAQSFTEITASIPLLHSVVPKAILALRQTRWCSLGTLREGDTAPRTGHAIHELVVLR
jgi:hypothetical protein